MKKALIAVDLSPVQLPQVLEQVYQEASLNYMEEIQRKSREESGL
ncbi:MAG: hypothetical protein WKG06_03260 [Segetibacter sp.]